MNKNLILIVSILAFVGCGSSSSEKKIDIVDYLSRTSMTKDFTHIITVDGHTKNSTYVDDVTVRPNLITIKKDDINSRSMTIIDDKVTIKYFDSNSTKILKRYINKGDKVSNYIKESKREILKIGTQKVGVRDTNISENCTIDGFIDNYKQFYLEYTNYDDKHNIMKIKCITKTVVDTRVEKEYIDSVSYTNGIVESKDDISYIYLQKDLGVIAEINDDCLASKSPDIIDDTLDSKKCLGEYYEYNLYQPQY